MAEPRDVEGLVRLTADETAFIDDADDVADLADLLAASRAEAHADWERDHDIAETTAAYTNFASSLECAVREHIPGADNRNQPENLYSDILDDVFARVDWFTIAVRIAHDVDDPDPDGIFTSDAILAVRRTATGSRTRCAPPWSATSAMRRTMPRCSPMSCACAPTPT